MKSGKLDRVISIREESYTIDAYGGRTITWVDKYSNVWASVEPVTSKEFLQTQQLQDAIDVRFRIRYISGITTQNRIGYNGDQYNIQAVLNVNERNRELIIMAKKIKE